MKRLVEIKDLSFSYPDGVDALKDINLSIYKGESVGVIGPNGAGKTTLLLCINGVLRGKGKIVIDGVELIDKNIFSIRKKIGLVFQDPNDQLFMPTVYEDVSFGPVQMDYPKEGIKESVGIALASVGMSGSENRSSHHLSFGEKKRISLAGTLAMEPDILLLDEPTSNLDPRGRRDFIELLKRMDVTKIIAAHDLELVLELCNRIVVLDKGEIVSVGSTIDVLSNEKVLSNHSLEQPVSLSLIPR